MDFRELINVAKQNALEQQNGTKTNRTGYSAKYSPPKKVTKEKKDLSENIKRFLAKREEEERQKALEKHQKAQELMARRGGKGKKKIEKMLKVIKSANKSVLEDAADAAECALGTESLEDDYGYTSAVASQFFNKLVDKYKNAPDESLFTEAKKRSMSSEELARARARVKDAIMKEQEEQSAPRTRKPRTARVEAEDTRSGVGEARGVACAPVAGRREEPVAAKPAEEKPRPVRRANVPPPPDFTTLLKLAEAKQHEAVKIEVPAESRKREPERPMTSKEKQEYEEQQAFLAMKRLRDKVKQDPNLSDKEKQAKLARLDELRAAGKLPNIPPLPVGKGGRAPAAAKPAAPPARAPGFKIPKRNEAGEPAKPGEKGLTGPPPAATGEPKAKLSSSTKTTSSSTSGLTNGKVASSGVPRASPATPAVPAARTSKPGAPSTAGAAPPPKASAPAPAVNGKSSAAPSKPSSMSSTAVKSKPTTTAASARPQSSSAGSKPSASGTSRQPSTATSSASSAAARPAPQQQQQAKRPPEPVAKTRQFPPPDVRRGPPVAKRPGAGPPTMGGGRPHPGAGGGPGKKRRIIDSDSEYDSEMDDFIDDGDCEEDYSSAIKEIFGYDKSRYRHEAYDDEDDNMESSYAQQMREEYISKKIGLMEDLEDMRMEEEEKRRKTVKKKGGPPKRK
ncbi:protein SPT2 homolog [Anopheles merus]|uniref:Protein SPT2 homolog n=1 Tax=Anopheles merus TaxID=30066 RepID=A0A182V8U2_ANOME|nr:protein SPT2 homolog [Anopheles merus]XP_041762229.1 protein SPT2 homolog [Anopheles merus]